MKNFGILLACILMVSCFGQNSSSLLFNYFNRPVDIMAGYESTPTKATIVQPGQVLFQSTDGGTTWQDLSKGLPDDIQVNQCFAKGNEVYLGTFDGKIYHSSDVESGTWDLQFDGKESEGAITGIFEGKSGIYFSIYMGGFYKQTPGTNTWKPMHQNLVSQSIFSVVETEVGTIWIAGGSGVYKSSDDCKTWKQVYAEGWVNSLVYKSNIFLANTVNGLLRSADNGEHWDCVVPDVFGVHKAMIIEDYFVIIRAGSQSNWAEVSIDEGKTWQSMDPGKPADINVFDLAKAGKYLFSCRKAGLSRSSDMGKTWELLLSPQTQDDLTLFEMVSSNSTLFVVVKKGGC